MIVNEQTQRVNITKSKIFNIIASINLDEAVTISEHITDRVVHWVVKETSDVILVGSNISWVSVEALTHLENTRCITIFLPEILGYLRNCINTNTIEVKGFDDILNPVLKISPHI